MVHRNRRNPFIGQANVLPPLRVSAWNNEQQKL
jgi:hypothetical protein